MNEDVRYKIYGYRWIVLLVYILITIALQMQWLTFAPIAREARIVYNATAAEIDLLAELFMFVFIVACIPAAHIINKFGIRIGISIGAFLTGIFSLSKGIFASNYSMIVVSHIGLAIAQPFIVNAVTKLAVHWFPINERATAVGLGTLAQFLGMIIVNIATPLIITIKIVGGVKQYDLQNMLMIYAVISVVSSVLLLVFLRENPPTPAGAEVDEERFLTFDGIIHILKHKGMRMIILLFFIGLGMFNAIATCIDQISEIKGFTSEQSGMIMGAMLISGIIGAVVIPPISDRHRKRKPFIVGAILFLIPGLAGMTFTQNYSLMLVFSGILGFFLLGVAAPIGFQYSAELSYPAPESLSQGIVLFAGQVSGIIFINGMNKIGMIISMKIFIVLTVLNLILSLMLRESPKISLGQK